MMVIQTDQTSCYDASGKIIPCAGSGQDGETRSGRLWPEFRFESGEFTVTDTLTGLMWPKNAGLLEFPVSWAEAPDEITQFNKSRLFGFDDWRMPERHELFSLISHARINPALPAGHPFLDVFPGYYWTADPCARFPRQAWYVHLGGGRVFKGMKHGSYMVWPVRTDSPIDTSPDRSGGPPSLQDGRFIDRHDSVIDRLTGLEWMTHADIAGGPVGWMEALETVREWNQRRGADSSGWRLPNIRELESVTDMAAHSPALAGAQFFKHVRPFYWSSTTSVYDPQYAWTLYSEDGNIGVGFKPNPEFYVWGVRDGRADLGKNPYKMIDSSSHTC